jgi:hypothetical protein
MRDKVFGHLWMDSLQICSEHTMNHHKLHGLCSCHVHAPRVHVRVCMCKRESVKRSHIFGWSLSKFAENILHLTTIYMGYILLAFHTRRMNVKTCHIITYFTVGASIPGSTGAAGTVASVNTCTAMFTR